MGRVIERECGMPTEAQRAACGNAWETLRRHLEARARDLCDEVRHYPTPIARCDVQLTKLIEQRSHALESLRIFKEAEAGRWRDADAASSDAMRWFISHYRPSDDDSEAALVAQLQAVVGRDRELI